MLDRISKTTHDSDLGPCASSGAEHERLEFRTASSRRVSLEICVVACGRKRAGLWSLALWGALLGRFLQGDSSEMRQGGTHGEGSRGQVLGPRVDVLAPELGQSGLRPPESGSSVEQESQQKQGNVAQLRAAGAPGAPADSSRVPAPRAGLGRTPLRDLAP